MDIIYKNGDITQCEEKIIIHGCNAQGKMNSGVAKSLREKYPDLTWKVYKKSFDENNGLTLGNVIVGRSNDKIILNAITQEFYGYDGKLYLNYSSLEKCLIFADSVCDFDINGVIEPVAMPRIGAGRAGGNWNIIENIIKSSFKRRQPIVYDYEEK